ncbi:hypothetical protein GEMRC1_013415 [Eukaryota sp. GEM-RC1]
MTSQQVSPQLSTVTLPKFTVLEETTFWNAFFSLVLLLLLLMILTSLGLSHILVLSLSSLSSVLKKLCDNVQSVFAFHVCVDIGFLLIEEVILACR